MPYKVPAHINNPIAIVIKRFVEREKGMVTESRKEIQRRFSGLDWEDQKRILLAFLSSGKGDREWAYPKLLNIWDDDFLPILKELFEKYHEERSTWAVIRYFPIDYILQHAEELSVGKDYYFFCRRLAYEQVEFHPDPQRLSPQDYLSVLIDQKYELSKEEALDILYKVLHNVCTDRFSKYNRVSGVDFIKLGEPVVSTDFNYIYTFTQQLQTLGCDEAIGEFSNWNQKLYDEIKKSDDFDRLNFEYPLEYNDFRIKIAKKYIYMMLPDKYKSENDTVPLLTNDIIEEMKEENPELDHLIDQFGLFEDCPF
jgi:hypothetical protein